MGHVTEQRQILLIPSSACQAACSYCFGPNRGAIMAPGTFQAALGWIESITRNQSSVEITFHGGEPLLAGIDWYRLALPRMRERFGGRLALTLQSNLWAMDDRFAALLGDFHIAVGTSLDGPEALNDAQRGADYFRRTMEGIAAARRKAVPVGVICTFTRWSAPRFREVCDFFARQDLPFGIHAVVGASAGDQGSALSPHDQEILFADLFLHYLENLGRMEIPTFDAMARSVGAGTGALCTFTDCLGGYLAVSADGGIYPCNRFAGRPGWRMADVRDNPSLAELRRTAPWRRLERHARRTVRACGACAHLPYCRGGCPFNALLAGNGRDPSCPAYRRVFHEIGERAVGEIFSEENLSPIVEKGMDRHGLYRKGPLLRLMRKGPHPKRAASRAREILSAAALGCVRTPEAAVNRLDRLGLVTDRSTAQRNISLLSRRLRRPALRPANLYLHVTDACGLGCAHCYVQRNGGPPVHMALETAVRTAVAGVRERFSKVVITGGEPLCHPRFEDLCRALAPVKAGGRGRLVLRTGLMESPSLSSAERIAAAFHSVVVSVDGDGDSHDQRRGKGRHRIVASNLERLRRRLPGMDLRLSAVLDARQAAGSEGEAVRRLARKLDASVRFNPLLPLGRAADARPALESVSPEPDDPWESVVEGPRPCGSCGLGSNLSVSPDGRCHPCHALTGNAHLLGNILEEGLTSILQSERFQSYKTATVDTNRRCAACALRYLCGGFCRAWSDGPAPDSPPADCSALHRRAGRRLADALEVLGLGVAAWQRQGLAFPDRPPLSHGT